MEPAEYRPDDRRSRTDTTPGGGAAMEPAEYRPDDTLQYGNVVLFSKSPQWSRPSIGRMTPARWAASWRTRWPQWSRPRIGRMTSRTGNSGLRRTGRNGAGRAWAGRLSRAGEDGQPAAEPQWSRPSIGRMTGAKSFGAAVNAKPQW